MIHAAITAALGCQLGAHQVEPEVKAVCAGEQMHGDCLQRCQLRVEGTLLRCPDRPCTGRGWPWGGNSWLTLPCSHWHARNVFPGSKLALGGASCCFCCEHIVRVLLSLMIFQEMEAGLGLSNFYLLP